MTERVRVYTRPDVADYDVIIEPGCLDHLAEHIVPVAPARAYVIVADSNVAALYGERAMHALAKTGASTVLRTFAAGERFKSVATWQALTTQLLQDGIGRDGCVIALGGGVTGDMAGFVAATYMRGIPVVQVPTTLLAMIDAAIGGKTGVDTALGKNLVGAFHQPKAVLIDPHVLRTLPDAQLRFGLAEAIKHGAIADAVYVQWIAASAASLFEHKTHTLASLIERSVEIKTHYVAEDVHESGARAALNFGHTIAHALEHVSNYEIAHGQAVALGMLVECTAGELAGITEPNTTDELRAALRSVGLETKLPPQSEADAMKLLAATRTDKKSRAGVQHYTLLARLGEVARASNGEWTAPLPDDVVREALARVSAG
jgi:3-dehydroquinate synthase